MRLHRSHKIRLDPTNVQASHLAQAAGTARFAYNWALAEWRRQYEACQLDPSLPTPNEAALRKQLNSVKREQYPWMLQVTKCAPQQGVRDLGAAFKKFFRGEARYPQFKKRGRSKDSFNISNDQVRVEGKRIKIPLLGWVRMGEASRFEGKLLSVTVSRTAGSWFAALAYEIEVDVPAHLGPPVGVDLGVKNLAILSNGTVYRSNKATKRGEAKLRRISKKLSRQVKFSRGWSKTKVNLQRHHEKIRNQRLDALHKLTHELTALYGFVGLEDLNAAGMVKNRSLAKSIQDASFGELVRQIEYKAKASGSTVVQVSRWFPSSKLCHVCGEKNQALTLNQRSWTCPCGARHDRDVNAAINILKEAQRVNLDAGSSLVYACGEECSGLGAVPAQTKPSSVKQEPNSVVDSYV